MIGKWMRRGTYFVLSGGLSILFLVRALGPHQEVVAAFDAYKALHEQRDVLGESQITAAADLEFFDVQRQHALNSLKEVVETLRFRQRMAVLTLRAQVREGLLQQSDLEDPSVATAYSKSHAHSAAHFDVVRKMHIIFTLPVSPTRAYAYVSLSGEDPDAGLRRYYMPFLLGARYGFEKVDGKWTVDQSPIAENAAASNEHVARLLDPTGNQFIFNLLSTRHEEEDDLWSPLRAKTSQL